MMFIKTFEASNYLSLQRCRINLGPLTVIVGPNGSGKSAILKALLNASLATRRDIGTSFGDGPHSFFAKRYAFAGRNDSMSFAYRVSSSKEEEPLLRYELGFRATFENAQVGYQITSEDITDLGSHDKILRRDQDTQLVESNGIESDVTLLSRLARKGPKENTEVNKFAHEFALGIKQVHSYRIEPYLVQQPCQIPRSNEDDDHEPFIGFRGDNVPAVLYHWSERFPDRIKELLGILKATDGDIVGFEFNTVGEQTVGFSIRYEKSRGVVPAPNLSSGTLCLIALSILLISGYGELMLLEEPENGLGPRAFQEFFKVLSQKCQQPDFPQVVMATHSPFVLSQKWNSLDLEHIYQVRMTKEGSITRSLRDFYDSGELGTEPSIGMNLSSAFQIASGEPL